MLTTQRIHDLIADGPSAASGARGIIEAERRFSPKSSTGYVQVEQRFVAFLGALADTRDTTPSPGYRHPAREARASGADGRREAERRFGDRDGDQDGGPRPLAPADIAWVSALPAPDQVTYRDAVQLARLAAQVAAGSPDERLVMSVWSPVRARHDRADAEHALARARRTWPAVPEQTATEAMLAALQADPQLAGLMSEHELRARARTLVGDAVTARDTARRDAIEHAERRLVEVQQARTEREAISA